MTKIFGNALQRMGNILVKRENKIAMVATGLILLACVVMGIFSINGFLGLTRPNASMFPQNIFHDNSSNLRGHPVYQLDRQGRSKAIGRIYLFEQRARVVFYDDLSLPNPAHGRMIVATGSLASLWSLVPDKNRSHINKDIQTLGEAVVDTMTKVTTHPKFSSTYQPEMLRLLSEVLNELNQDAAVSQKFDATSKVFVDEYAERLSLATSDILAPHVAEALMEVVTPSWEGFSRLITGGQLNIVPFETISTKLLANDDFKKIVSSELLKFASDNRVLTAGTELGGIVAEKILDKAEFKILAKNIFYDPAFRGSFRELELVAGQSANGIFKKITGRGDDLIPDPLVMRVLRSMALGRVRVLAIWLPNDEANNSLAERMGAVSAMESL